MDKRAVAVHHPRLELLVATGKLRAHGAAVKSVPEADKVFLVRAVFLERVGFGKFDAVFRRFAAGAEQEDLILAWVRRNLAEHLSQRGTVFVREHVGREQRAIHHLAHGGGNLSATVASVGDEHAARPVNPAVTPFVGHDEIFGFVPENRRLARHRARLAAA